MTGTTEGRLPGQAVCRPRAVPHRAFGALRLLRCLVLAGLGVFLGAEPFDGDAQYGFADAVLRSASPHGNDSPPPPSPTDLSPSRDVPSGRPLRFAGATLTLSATTGPARSQVRLLAASRRCARSRIAEPPALSQPHVTSLQWTHGHALPAARGPV